MKIITIASLVGFCNRGSEALLRTRIESIRKLIPEVKFYILTVYSETCKEISGVEYIEIFGARREKLFSPFYIFSSLFKALWWNINILLFRIFKISWSNAIEKMASSDLFISSGGDVLGEDYGFLTFLLGGYFLSLGIFLKKPLIIYSEGVGPFKSKLGKMLAKFIFKNAKYISLREEISLQHLNILGIKGGRIEISADSGFLLEPSRRKDLNFKKGRGKLIGFAISRLVSELSKYSKEKSYEGFIDLMAKLTDRIIKETKSNVIMIPHVIQPKRDDYQTTLDVFQKVKNKKRVKILGNEFSASDFKKIISYCDILIASRLHAAIAGLSSFVPVIGISYSHKMYGIFKQVGVSELAVDIKNLDWRITKKIKEVLKNKNKIKNKLKKRIPEIKKLAEKPAFVVAEYLNKTTQE